MMPDFNDPDQRKQINDMIRDAIDAWLDKQFATFGKWSLAGLGSAALAALAYVYFTSHGLK
jgi:hypothetical protein